MKIVAIMVSVVVFAVTAAIIGAVSRQVARENSFTIEVAAVIITSYLLLWGIVLSLL